MSYYCRLYGYRGPTPTTCCDRRPKPWGSPSSYCFLRRWLLITLRSRNSMRLLVRLAERRKKTSEDGSEESSWRKIVVLDGLFQARTIHVPWLRVYPAIRRTLSLPAIEPSMPTGLLLVTEPRGSAIFTVFDRLILSCSLIWVLTIFRILLFFLRTRQQLLWRRLLKSGVNVNNPVWSSLTVAQCGFDIRFEIAFTGLVVHNWEENLKWINAICVFVLSSIRTNTRERYELVFPH